MNLAILYRTATVNGQVHEVVRAIFPIGEITKEQEQELQTKLLSKNYNLKFQRMLNVDELKAMTLDPQL